MLLLEAFSQPKYSPKFVYGRGSAVDQTGGACDAPSDDAPVRSSPSDPRGGMHDASLWTPVGCREGKGNTSPIPHCLGVSVLRASPRHAAPVLIIQTRRLWV